ncbi:ABC transporter substrate-binding protein [Nocardia sp. NPDC050717]|uniref:ABC transporter substrate-binding protein n=1 Tax=Nocardia sp. NPDC050717 TaxID=3157221 RepID=UPI0033E57B37
MIRPPLISMFAAAALVLAGCAGGTAGSSGDPNHLRVAYGWYPTCLDYAQSNPTAIFGRQVLDTLLSEDLATGELKPYLAESWTSSDEGRTYEFTLRPGVTFSNGESLTAQVVADNFRTLWQLAQRGVSPTPGAYLRGFDRAEAVDERTVRVHFTQPNAGFLQANTEGQFGIIAPASLAKTPEERCAQGTIGSGPFVLDHVVQDERLEYVRRAGYNWAPPTFGRQGEAALERLTIHIVPEEGGRAAGLIAGDYDIAYSIFQTGVDQAKGNDQVQSVLAPNRGVVNSFLPNTADPILADRAVRQALQHGIDRRQLVSAFYGTGVEPATDIVSRGHPYYRDRSAQLRHDPALSRSLLDAAGWTPGPDGIRVKDGRRLALTLNYVSGSIGAVQSGWEYVQSELAEIGVELVLAPISNAQQTDLRGSGQWQLTIAQGAARGDADGIAAYYATQLSVYKGLAPRPEIDALLAEQALTADKTERHRIVDDAVDKIVDDAYGIPLYDSAQVLLVRSAVRELTFPVNSWEPIFYRVDKE